MALTHEQLEQLKAPFAVEDTEFLNGFAYIKEKAITDRIETVDPSWSISVKSVEERDKKVYVTVSLTVCGVTRDGVGMDNVHQHNEPEKAAATDALKRAARLFGIGRYLLDFSSLNIKNETQLHAYLNGDTAPAPQKQAKAQKQQPDKNPFTGSPQPSAAPTVDGTLATEPTNEVETRMSKKNTPFLVIAGNTFWSTRPLKEIGFDVNELANVGKHTLPADVVVEYVIAGEYKKPIRIQRQDTYAVAEVA